MGERECVGVWEGGREGECVGVGVWEGGREVGDECCSNKLARRFKISMSN